MTFVSTLKTSVQRLNNLFFPRLCEVCESALVEGEDVLCTACNIDLPRTGFHLQADNRMERLFWGQCELERSTAWFFYHKGSPFLRPIHRFKYNGRKDVAFQLGRLCATELMADDFFAGIDLLIPIPLHPSRQRKRGYNQSMYIAQGVSQATGIPLSTDVLVRIRDGESQTEKPAYERRSDMQGSFALKQATPIVGKHLLLIDDVLTTGATAMACIQTLKETEGVRISVLTLCLAN